MRRTRFAGRSPSWTTSAGLVPHGNRLHDEAVRWLAGRHAADGVEGCLKTTVGDVSVANKDIEQARQEALARDLPGNPGRFTPGAGHRQLVQLHRPGVKAACYPTSLSPYKEKCVSSLVGGLKCKGRCGTICNGLCSDCAHCRLPEPRSVHRSLGAQSFVLQLHLVPRVRRLLQRSGLHRFTRRVDVEVNV